MACPADDLESYEILAQYGELQRVQVSHLGAGVGSRRSIRFLWAEGHDDYSCEVGFSPAIQFDAKTPYL
jgi:hypothetical protein